MIIIADGGSTKTSWCLIDNAGTRSYFSSEGYNPYFIDTPGIVASMEGSLPATLDRSGITELYYYGAGCSTPEKVETVASAMRKVFTAANVYVGHDLLAAARALLGLEQGFAAILGTGTNSCIYDGKDVVYNIDSLAYFLGDEGSGSFIGKRLLRDYLRGYLPDGLQEIFRDTYKLEKEEIFDRLYNQPLPNRFLASFAKFTYENRNISYCREVVRDGFEAFFQNLVVHYPNYQDYTFNCVGSVAYNFRDELTAVANSHGMKVGKIIQAPIDDLVDYHTVLTK
ncbi:N-acetylglucosamine kinase [Hymenobacter cavernae]|uniref:ATPase n=1 Tax=Hymenobacter cavernae TaxID=2044852 RepID=A0ABQ1U8R7_9BACT|nr:N-acetylglucosamine kinase [Hymenobacter cavernae]GGF13264.1 ATPase [Hymenobacter cavernae]